MGDGGWGMGDGDGDAGNDSVRSGLVVAAPWMLIIPTHVERSNGKSYRDLRVWQTAISLVLEVYRITESFPHAERFGLTSQLRRAAVSVPSNIAEGHARSTRGEYKNSLSSARGVGRGNRSATDVGQRAGPCATRIRRKGFRVLRDRQSNDHESETRPLTELSAAHPPSPIPHPYRFSSQRTFTITQRPRHFASSK